MTRRGRVLLLAVAAVLALPACSSGSGADRYAVELRRLADRSRVPTGIDRPQVEQSLERAFAQADRFALADKGLAGDVWFAEIERDTSRDLSLELRVEAPPELHKTLGSAPLSASILLERDQKSREVDAVVDLELALELAVEVLEARVSLAGGDRRAIASLLSADDPELVILVLEWLRDNGQRGQSGDEVADLLLHRDDRVALLAIEALGTVGDPEHVPALLAAVRLADPANALRTYDALAKLGGAEAMRFLEFAAANEDDLEQRSAAKNALQQVRESPGGSRQSLGPHSQRALGHRP